MDNYSHDGVRQERTGWRDEKVSNRHREYGFNCPAVDIDFVLLEFNHGRACALMELKAITANRANLNLSKNYSLRALSDLGSRAMIPAFLSVYCFNTWGYWVKPINDEARKYIDGWTDFTELEYVQLLYEIRGELLPEDIKVKLSRKKPPRTKPREVK